ncbi:DUF2330 domain-containing protein [uncultured Flavobacterium sp.]|uniref:DUF2330 domain-containing protein n=1 Tax=uncultured Flavobacterium sp. TaxID=165435 RepID=UPI0030ED9D70|tara:strand:+ start:115430 stop:116926 length:1497 start_codon:yes stop_codon:yes gene_type:complete
MKKKVILVLLVFIMLPILQSFCGFYVSTGDTKIFNQASEVILVRDGNKNTVTMNSDFKGDVKDFAIVIPVPTVLKESDIKVVRKDIFNKLNKYSEPRLVEYYDEHPCQPKYRYDDMMVMESVSANSIKMVTKKEKDLGVTIEAKYTVGEYDILILSAKESTGLKTWLLQNDYKIPAKAEEVLEPYIKSKMNFFVVKVNLAEMKKLGRNELSPIQISFESEKFMLPIRLGMANANGAQDLIIYAFTKNGRVESTNYRTVKIPTDKNIPTFMREKFQNFYQDMFSKQYKKYGKNAVFTEYAWDLSSHNYQKCDPCSTTPPSYAELKDAGVFFANYRTPEGWQGSDYEGNLFFTRLHVRYDRANFPMDLQFQETMDQQSFQGRYIMQHSVNVDMETCSEGRRYYNDVLNRRENELETLANLTNWDTDSYDDYTNEIRTKLGYKNAKSDTKKGGLFFFSKGNKPNKTLPILLQLSGFALIAFLIYKRKTLLPKLAVVKNFLF